MKVLILISTNTNNTNKNSTQSTTFLCPHTAVCQLKNLTLRKVLIFGIWLFWAYIWLFFTSKRVFFRIWLFSKNYSWGKKSYFFQKVLIFGIWLFWAYIRLFFTSKRVFFRIWLLEKITPGEKKSFFFLWTLFNAVLTQQALGLK